MSETTFRALLMEEQDGAVHGSVQTLPISALPPGEVTVQVAYSTLNYKDALAITNTGKIIRSFPLVPGIDYAGTVVESNSSEYKSGDKVILTGWFVGERYWGGLAQLARAKAEWLVPLPDGMTLQQAMAIGTAGFTAMMAIDALEKHGLTPGGREVVVTGATGGVGSIAVAVLANLGYNVVAATGRPEETDYLKQLGAQSIIERQAISAPSNRPMESERWAGAIDNVGGDVLAGLIRSMATRASIAVVGNAGGPAFSTTVFPFLLRGINLLGIGSADFPAEQRPALWHRLANELPMHLLDEMTKVVPLSEAQTVSQAIIKNQIRGRTVVDVNA